MRIAFIAGEDPGTGPTGGAWSYIEAMATALTALGHSASVIIPTNSSSRTIHESGFQIIRVALHPAMRRFPFPIGRGASSFAMAARLRHTFNEERFDIVESPDVLGISAAIRGGSVPVVLRLHASGMNLEERNLPPGLRSWIALRWINRIEQRARRLASAISAPSSFALSAARVGEDYEKPYRIISNPVRDVFFRARRNPSSSPVIVFAGWLTRAKGVDIALKLMPKVLREFPDAQLVLAGADPPLLLRAGISARSMAGQLDRGVAAHIGFVGQASADCLSQLFSRATAAIFPSQYETFGLACAEAMVVGCPVVVAVGTALAELVDHVGGGLIVDRSADAFAAGVIRTIKASSSQEPTIIPRHTQAVSRFDSMRVASETLEFFKEVINRA